jgi:RNAse (barnase) inhibitor barstar
VVVENEQGEEELWAKVAGVEGLFVDVAPPPREVLVLRGCAPTGRLAEALADVGAQESLGFLTVEVSETGGVEWWHLVDATVIAHTGNAADPSLVDIVVGAGVPDPDWCAGVPKSPQFKLFTDGDRPAGTCSGVEGLYRRPRVAARPPLMLVGCEPVGLLGTLRGSVDLGQRYGCDLWALDRAGRVMNDRSVDLAIRDVRPSVLGGALLDVAIRFTNAHQLVPTAARPVWETWYRSRPTELNTWAGYPEAGRKAWLELALMVWGAAKENPYAQRDVYHLDGRFVTDEEGLYCALGEAIGGPGAYYGWNWDAVADCLGHGVPLPFKLVWHESEVARATFALDHGDSSTGESYFEVILDLLRRYGVDVVLQ